MKREEYSKKFKEQLLDLENIKMFKEMKNGKDNRELIILHNLDLVKIVVDAYGNDYDKEELYQIGVLELINSVDKFNCDKRKGFIRYALKNVKKRIEEVLNGLSNYEMIVNCEYIIDIDTDIESNYEKKELEKELKTYINNLPQISREPVKMYFGFYGKCYSFEEIAEVFGVSKSLIKRIIASELRTIRKLISNKEFDKIVKAFQKTK